MAEVKPNTIVKLTPEMKRELQALETDIEAAEAAIKVLERLNMGTKDIEDKLAWARNVRSTLLEEFG